MKYQIEKRHVLGYGTMETVYVIYDTEARKTISKAYKTKKKAETALTRLLSK